MISNAAQLAPVDASVSEWDKNWATVTKDPFDFSAWEYLLRIAENANGGITKGSSDEDVDNLRLVFDHMLARFPLCFGYWKKYADWELSIVDTVKAESIYERGVIAIQNSVELWTHYLSFVAEYYNDEDALRRYTQVSTLRPLTDLLPLDRLDALSAQVRLQPLKQLPSGEHTQKTQTDFHLDIRQIIAQDKSLIYKQTQARVHDKWKFESQIKRGYFHVKPLDDPQIENWRKYLDHEETSDDAFGIYTLYERALVPLASYEEFWSRYAKFLVAREDFDNARNVFLRATLVHIPDTYPHPTTTNRSRPSIALQYAQFEEQHGESIQVARALLTDLHKRTPNNFEVCKRFLYFEMRNQPTQNAEAFFLIVEKFILAATSTKVKEKAKYVYQVEKDVQGARVLYERAIETAPDSKLVNFAYLLFELSVADKAAIEEAWKKIKENVELDGSAKQVIGKRYLEYLVEVGACVRELAAVEYWVTCKRGGGEVRKRKAADVNGDAKRVKE